MYKHIFGPVPSRRLGMSLGVDLVPHKVCSLDCVYCECGETTLLTTERKEYIKFDKIVEELNEFFNQNPDPDYITFSGSGEPTLNSRIGDVIIFLKKLRPKVPIAVLTNGTLLNNKKVREELLQADLVLPSFDAAIECEFEKINTPAKNISVNEYLNGLVEFRKEFKGKIWLEIMIIPDFNNSNENILMLKNAIKKINPDKIQINSLDRPGTIEGLKVATQAELRNIMEIWNLPNTEIILPVRKKEEIKTYRQDTENTVFETIFRRPCTIEDLCEILGLHHNEINKYLSILENEGKIHTQKLDRGLFYMIKK